jgi:hypothetical protein
MMGSIKAHHDGIVAFSQTDFTEDLKKITIPVLVMHGDDDQIVPFPDSATAFSETPQERYAEDVPQLSTRYARISQHARTCDIGTSGLVRQRPGATRGPKPSARPEASRTTR